MKIKQNNKKGQMEIMGLAIVVILMVSGMLFAVKFVLFKPETTYRKDYTNTQLAANMLNTLLNTNTNCNDVTIGELLQDASRDTSYIDCSGISSQDYVQDVVEGLLGNTLSIDLKKDYYFKASVPDKVVVNVSEEINNRERERKTHFLQTDTGVMTIILDIYS